MKRFLPLLVLLFILSMTFVAADGCIFIPPGYYDDVTEPTQKAIIIHDGTQEQLMLQVSYGGEADNFAWVVPFPVVPEINITNPYIFNEAYELTASKYRNAPSLHPFGGERYLSANPDQSVQVLDQKQIDVYEATTLAANDANALEKWLADNNYIVPPNTNEVLQPYIDQEWYYVAFKINLEGYLAELFPALEPYGYEVSSSDEFKEAIKEIATDYVVENKPYNELKPLVGELNLESYYQVIREDTYKTQLKEYHGYPQSDIISRMSSQLQEIIAGVYHTNIITRCTDSNKHICEEQNVIPEDTAFAIVMDNCGLSCRDLEVRQSLSIEEATQIIKKAYLNDDAQALEYVGTIQKYDHDDLEDYRRRVERRTEDAIELEVQDRLKLIAVQELSPLLSQAANYNAIPRVLAQDIFDDIINEVPYSQSKAAKVPFLGSSHYTMWELMYTGLHDEVLVASAFKSNIESAIETKSRATQNSLQRGTLKSLHFTFDSPIPVYPLRISALNKGESEILLYIFAKNKMNITSMKGFTLERARQLTWDDLNKSSYHYGHPYKMYMYEPSMPNPMKGSLIDYIDDEYYVTKYRAVMTSEDMTSDVYFEQAPNNKEYQIVKTEDWFVLKWILAILGILIGVGLLYGFNVGVFMLIALGWNRITSSWWNVKYKKMFCYAIPIPLVIIAVPIVDAITKWRNWEDFWLSWIDPFRFIFEKFDYFLPETIAAVIAFAIFAVFWFVIFRVVHQMITTAGEERKSKPKE